MRAAVALNNGKMENLDASIKIFRDAVTKNPEANDIRMNLIKAYLATGNLESAEKELHEFLLAGTPAIRKRNCFSPAHASGKEVQGCHAAL